MARLTTSYAEQDPEERSKLEVYLGKLAAAGVSQPEVVEPVELPTNNASVVADYSAKLPRALEETTLRLPRSDDPAYQRLPEGQGLESSLTKSGDDYVYEGRRFKNPDEIEQIRWNEQQSAKQSRLANTPGTGQYEIAHPRVESPDERLAYNMAHRPTPDGPTADVASMRVFGRAWSALTPSEQAVIEPRSAVFAKAAQGMTPYQIASMDQRRADSEWRHDQAEAKAKAKKGSGGGGPAAPDDATTEYLTGVAKDQLKVDELEPAWSARIHAIAIAPRKSRPAMEASLTKDLQEAPRKAQALLKAGGGDERTDDEYVADEERAHPGFTVYDVRRSKETRQNARAIGKLRNDMQQAQRLINATNSLRHFINARNESLSQGVHPVDQYTNRAAYNAAIAKANGALSEMSKANDRFAKIEQEEDFPDYLSPAATEQIDKLEYVFRSASDAMVGEYGYRTLSKGEVGATREGAHAPAPTKSKSQQAFDTALDL